MEQYTINLDLERVLKRSFIYFRFLKENHPKPKARQHKKTIKYRYKSIPLLKTYPPFLRLLISNLTPISLADCRLSKAVELKTAPMGDVINNILKPAHPYCL